MDASGYSLSDIAALMGNRDGGMFGGGSSGMGVLIILFFLIFAGGFGGFGARAADGGFATSAEVQRGFDNQNTVANQRETLAAVTAGTAQSVAATNQVFHDLVGYVGDKYNELDRDVLGVSAAIQQSISNQNNCCCNTLRAIDGVNYNNATNTAAIQSSIASGINDIKAQLAQNKIEALQSEVEALRLAQATSNVVRYPSNWSYNAGPSPFCGGCGCGC